MPSRKRISNLKVSQIMDDVDMRCCMCPLERGLPPPIRNGQIHHIDGDASNDQIDNLVYLCLDCHEEAGKVGKAARCWNPDLIKRRRDRLVGRIQAESRPSHHGSQAFRGALDALIVMDVRTLTARGDDWSVIEGSLWAIQRYPVEMGPPARRAILAFLYDVSGSTRFRMPSRIADNISNRTIEILPIRALQERSNDLTVEDLDLMETAAEIGGDIAYDGALYCRKLEIVDAGAQILWRLLSYAKTRSLPGLEKLVRTYFAQAFDGARRSSTPLAVDLLEAFKKHGEGREWRRLRLPGKFLEAMADEEDD
jgi:hypothetical protein